MLSTKTCPKCKSTKVIKNARVVSRFPYLRYLYYGYDLLVEISKRPNALVFQNRRDGHLVAFVCGNCAYTELYLDNARELYEIYEKNKLA